MLRDRMEDATPTVNSYAMLSRDAMRSPSPLVAPDLEVQRSIESEEVAALHDGQSVAWDFFNGTIACHPEIAAAGDPR